MTDNDNKEKVVEHHKQHNLCSTRPPYRQGRKLTAVKVYTVTSESQHLFVYGVPKIKLRNELKALCMRYGQVKNVHAVADYKTEIFTECYHVQYERIQSARVAKRVLDMRSFYGGILHVCYAPEFETVQETRGKLMQRKRDVMRRLQNESENETNNYSNYNFIEPQINNPHVGHSVGNNEGMEASCSSQYQIYNPHVGNSVTNNDSAEANSSSQYQIGSYVKNNEGGGKFSRKRKTFAEFEDPLLAINTKYVKQAETKQVEFNENICLENNEKKFGEYGPFLENYVPQIKGTNIKEMPKLIPSQVISNNKCVRANKRIVFRKK